MRIYGLGPKLLRGIFFEISELAYLYKVVQRSKKSYKNTKVMEVTVTYGNSLAAHSHTFSAIFGLFAIFDHNFTNILGLSSNKDENYVFVVHLKGLLLPEKKLKTSSKSIHKRRRNDYSNYIQDSHVRPLVDGH